ncbi:hypothetical protein [Corynebacterium cystitidis]|uniref:hypothetical protein n=1 Tax=Corynebacterium cystitidis TaxID=35757 RepID=UPI0012FD5B60|nr:hypothetical protein [Corynebacterium cystitidis]
MNDEETHEKETGQNTISQVDLALILRRVLLFFFHVPDRTAFALLVDCYAIPI